LAECPEWFHSIELAPNVVTPGRKSAELLQQELARIALPDLRGKSVLDIGAYDGFFSFAAERLGASRVVALDHYVWSTDMAGYLKDWRESQQTGRALPPPHLSRHFRPDELPGRKPFDLAHRALGSKVEAVVADFMTTDLSKLGMFDVVLFMGVLYHLEEPLTAVRRLRAVTAPGGLAVIETEAIATLGLEGRACCEFFPGAELNNDPSNWWSPNARALEGMLRAAGFPDVTILKDGSDPQTWDLLKGLIKGFMKGRFFLPVARYRAFAHARA
jgi:tRNA (mo5U34)-methyltransferase